MTKLTEQHLIEFGFKRTDVTKEESGEKNDFYYYTLDIGDLSILSSDSDTKEDFHVGLFDYNDLNVYDYETLKELINVLRKMNEQTLQKKLNKSKS